MLGRWFAISAFLVGVGASETIVADETQAGRRPPLPEQILTESVTDIDAPEEGELEFAFNGLSVRSLPRGSHVFMTSVEAEWRATKQLGFRLEPSFVSTGSGTSQREFTFQGAAAWGFAHDYANDFHGQLEATGRLAKEQSLAAEPGDSPLPITLGVRLAKRYGPITLRPGLGMETGARPAHVPLWFGAGLLYELGRDGRLGFLGIEVDADGGRKTPVILAAELMADMKAINLPFRFGVAVPWVVGAGPAEPVLGIYLRLLMRTEVE